MKTQLLTGAALACLIGTAGIARGQQTISSTNKWAWGENCGWLNWNGGGPATVFVRNTYLTGFVWGENIGWVNLGGTPADSVHFADVDASDFGVNIDVNGLLSGFAWGENVGWINFEGGALASPPNPARLDRPASRFRGYAWCETIGWINMDDADDFVGIIPACGSADFNCDGQTGTDQDIEAFFACLAGTCPPAPCRSSADFNADGNLGTDQDIEAFFRVLGGGPC
jgi:hypothetical protein